MGSDQEKAYSYQNARHDRSTEDVLQAVSNGNKQQGSNDIEETKEHSEGSILSMAGQVLGHARSIIGLCKK